MSARAVAARRGLSLVELLIAGGLLVVVAAKVFFVITSTMRFSRDETASLFLSSHADRVLDQIAYAVIGSDRQTLVPDAEAPFYTTDLNYRVSLGVEDGRVVWAEPERIRLEVDTGRHIVWAESPETADERRVVWSNLVRPFLDGEVENGIDDNGNGLVDESGLSFEIHGESVVIRLTLGFEGGETATATRTVEAVVTCRNFVDS